VDIKSRFVRMGSDTVGEYYQIAFIGVAIIVAGMQLLHMFNHPH